MKSFQHPELMKCNPLAESINEDNNEQANESSDIVNTDLQNLTKAQTNTSKPNHQQQYRILHPDLPTNSNLVTSSNQIMTSNIPTTRIPTTNIQNVCPSTTINLNQQQPISTNYMVGTAGLFSFFRNFIPRL